MPMLMIYFVCLDIYISGNKSAYQLNSKVSVKCYSNLTVYSITWRNAISNELVSKNLNLQCLLLQYERITLQMNKTRYICQAIIVLPGGKMVSKSKDFTILITAEKTPLGYSPGNPITENFLSFSPYNFYMFQMIKVK